MLIHLFDLINLFCRCISVHFTTFFLVWASSILLMCFINLVCVSMEYSGLLSTHICKYKYNIWCAFMHVALATTEGVIYTVYEVKWQLCDIKYVNKRKINTVVFHHGTTLISFSLCWVTKMPWSLCPTQGSSLGHINVWMNRKNSGWGKPASLVY